MPLDYYYLGDVSVRRLFVLFQRRAFLCFQIRNVETRTCLDTMGRKSGENLGMTYCHSLGGNQVFAYTKRQQIMSDDNCLDASTRTGPVKLVRCHGMAGNQAWAYSDTVSVCNKYLIYCHKHLVARILTAFSKSVVFQIERHTGSKQTF